MDTRHNRRAARVDMNMDMDIAGMQIFGELHMIFVLCGGTCILLCPLVQIQNQGGTGNHAFACPLRMQSRRRCIFKVYLGMNLRQGGKRRQRCDDGISRF